ncbi:sugar-tranasporter [Hirsutella rhossiliensis]
MDFYTTTLAALCGLCAVLVYHKHGFRDAKDANSARQATACQFQRRFLFVYALAVGADWLQASSLPRSRQGSRLTGAAQGPHLYAWYRYDKQLPEELVALMYATGFAAGAVSAAVAGPLMDCLGPDLGCLAYSLFASTSCGLIESDKPSRLLLGRVCGGFATTFLFSAFESWMVTKYHTLGLDDSTLPLGTVLSNMTLVSSTVAIAMGIASDQLVRISGSRGLPFRAASWCSIAASLAILCLWRNYRYIRPTHDDRLEGFARGSWRAITRKRTMALGLASCCFEGAMYLFVFFWTAALKCVRRQADTEGELPLGLIFASFMCAMMIGSTVASGPLMTFSGQSATRDLIIAMLVACGSLSCAVLLDSERMLFGVFCILEASIGAYFPVMGYLKGEHVDDKDRNLVYSIFRLPLNTLVLVAHCLDTEGEWTRHEPVVMRRLTQSLTGDEHRDRVFLTLAGMLLAASLVVKQSLAS